MQRISVNLTNDCDGNQLIYNDDLPVIGNKNSALQKSFKTDFLTVIGNAKLRTLFVIFLCKIICINYFIVKFVKMYSLIFNCIVGSIY